MVDLYKKFNGKPYKIRVHHLREYDGYGNILSHGGETRVTLENAEQIVVAAGVATCVKTDTFNRRVGRNIAIQRALRDLDMKGRRHNSPRLTDKGLRQLADSIQETPENW